MSIQSDAEVAANVQVGGTDRSGLFYDSSTHVWRTKNQAGTLSNLVTGVDSVSNSDGTLTISPTTGTVVASRTAITGDVAIAGASNTSVLATVNVNVGTFGSATQVAQVTANAKGLTTAASSVSIQIAESQVTNLTTDLAAKQPLDSDLTTIAGLTATTDTFLQAKSSAWTTRTPTQVTADLDVATTSLKGLMSSTDKTRADNWHNKAVYNVLDNGILPGNTGAANVTAWNALMVVLANSTATVYFPPSSGTYDFASVCAIPAGVHVRVMGGGTVTRTSEAFGTILRTTSGTADMFTCGDWYQEFTDIVFRTSVTRTAGACINSGNNVGIEVSNCTFNAPFNGIVLSGGASAGNLAIIRNCHFTDTVNFSIQVDGTNANSIISDCTADGAPAAVAHLEVNACGSLLVSNCDFIRATNNLRLNPDSGTKGVFSVYFTNVFFDTAAGSSVKFMGGAAGTNIQRVKFVNCWFSGSVTGCEFAAVTSTNKATAIDFVNCDIYSNSANGILATEVQDFSLNNCRIAGNTTAGVNTVAATGSVTKFNIQNCTVGPTAGIGANGIGINIQAGTYGGYVISGNDVRGNTSNANITDSGSVATTDLKNIADNLGHLIKHAIATNRGGVTSGTGETLLMTARIPPNAVSVGQTFRVTLFGNSSSTGTLAMKVKVGANGTTADTAVWTPATSAAQVANHRASLSCTLYVTAIGGAGAIGADGIARFSNLFVEEAAIAAPATTTIVTTAAWFIDVTCACSVGTFTVTEGVIEAL